MAVKVICMLFVAVVVATTDAGVVVRFNGGASSHKEIGGAVGVELGGKDEKVAKVRSSGYVDVGAKAKGGAYVGAVDGKNITGVGVDGQIGGDFKVEGQGETGVIYKDGKVDAYGKGKTKVDKSVKVGGGGFLGEVDQHIADETIQRGSLDDLRNWKK